MFEANPFFSKVLKKKLESAPVHGDFKVFSCGIGAEESELYYFHDTQSFLKESNMGNVSKVRSFKPIKVVPLNRFAEELRECDFLKTDIEEMDFFALLGASKILANVHFIQFELGIGADFNDRKVMNEDYYSLLEADFDLFVLRDNNPIWEAFPTLPLLITLNSGTKLLLKILQSSGVGFNIVGINKKKLFPEFLVPEISLLSFH